MVFGSLKKLFSRNKEPVELPMEEGVGEEPMKDKVVVRIENLTGVNDVERIERLVKQGHILFLKISQLQTQH